MLKRKEQQMSKIEASIRDLDNSPLLEYRLQHEYLPVIGEGNLDAKIMFIGEAPGETEAKCGKPFCGRSGKILDEFLHFIGLRRGDTYITNIVKDRPPHNRDPKPEELALYAPFLDKQIEIIEPKVIATLGRFSMNYILERYAGMNEIPTISELHGKTFEASALYGKISIIPLFHPAVAIYNQKSKADLLGDFKTLKAYL